MSRHVGNQYELQSKQHLESLGLLHIASNIVVPGGEVDLLMQSTVQLHEYLYFGEVCIVEVKGRKRASEWNVELVSLKKAKRWREAARYVLWKLEEEEWRLPLPLSGIQFVLVEIENQQLEVNWHAIDLDLG